MDCFMDFIYGIDNVANGVNDYLLMVVFIKENYLLMAVVYWIYNIL